MAMYEFKLFADYFQIYLQDEDVDGDLSDSWNDYAADNLLAIAPGTIGIGTVRNMTVPVTVEIVDSQIDDSFEEWDQVNECSIVITSDKIVISGCSDYLPEAPRIKVTPGTYRARIFYGGLKTLSYDGVTGKDHYKVVLWLDNEIKPTKVLKKRE